MNQKVLPSASRVFDFDRGAYWVADLLIIAVVAVAGFGLLYFFDIGSAPFVEEVPISTDLRSLPGYALLSLTRSLIALLISYTFALVYGTIAARSPSYERVMIPMLDVLQSLPVLTFLPGFVLALTALFPGSRWGLELSCILMIVTGQVWNLVFAYYESQRQITPELRDFTRLARLTPTQKFLVLDLPNGVRPLVYNGMMSMAGGWFFLTLCEAFVLGEKSYRLPGLGSYLGVSFERGEHGGFVAGLVALFVMIIGVDFLLWKPLIAWVSQYRDNAESGDSELPPRSLFLDVLRRTRLQRWISDVVDRAAHAIGSRIEGAMAARAFRAGKGIPGAVAAAGGGAGALPGGVDAAKPGTADGRNADTPASLAAARLVQPFHPFVTPIASNVGAVVRSGAQLLGQARTRRRASRTKGPWMQWLASFAIGGVVFYLLPKLPDVARHLSRVRSDDWLELSRALLMTGVKVAAVLVFATIWTVPVGLWIGQRRRIATWVEPVIQNLAAFPAPVLYPLIALWVSDAGVPPFLLAIILMTLGNQWYMLFNVLSGSSRISAELKLVARVYRFSQWRIFTKFYVPAILPSLITGWISAAGGAWNASIVAEIVFYPGGSVQTEGIGAEITRATEQGNFPRLVAAIIVITIALVVVNRTLWRTLNEYVEKVK